MTRCKGFVAYFNGLRLGIRCGVLSATEETCHDFSSYDRKPSVIVSARHLLLFFARRAGANQTNAIVDFARKTHSVG